MANYSRDRKEKIVMFENISTPGTYTYDIGSLVKNGRIFAVQALGGTGADGTVSIEQTVIGGDNWFSAGNQASFDLVAGGNNGANWEGIADNVPLRIVLDLIAGTVEEVSISKPRKR